MSYFNEDSLLASNTAPGLVSVQANSGLSVDAAGNISNADRGSSQLIIKSINVQGDGAFTANSNSSVVTFAPGGRMVLNIVGNVISITDNAHAPKTTRCRDYLGLFTQPDVVATLPEDTFIFAEGGNGGLTITSNAESKIITFTHNGILSVNTIGTGISSVNSANVGTIILNSNVNTSSNTVVIRDSAGSFAANIVTANVTGTILTAAQPNITSVGSLTSVTVTGNATVGNLSTAGQITATGNITTLGTVDTSVINFNRMKYGTGPYNIGSVGSFTLDFNNGTLQTATITGTSTITLANVSAGKTVRLIVQNTSGISSRSITHLSLIHI